MKILDVKYYAWTKYFPVEKDGKCCYGSHFYPTRAANPLPDEMVCRRERAWREYVRERDGDPEFNGFRETIGWRGETYGDM